MQLLIAIANICAAVACFVVAMRLLTFRRRQRRYRPLISFLAWVMINISLVGGVWLLAEGVSYLPLAIGIALVATYLAVRSIAAKGNLAELLERALP
ncbi:MAG: phage holin family protein [Pseudomonadota bacterium]